MDSEYIPPPSAGVIALPERGLTQQRELAEPEPPPERLGRLRRVIVELDDGRRVVFEGVTAVDYSLQCRDRSSYLGYSRGGPSLDSRNVDGQLELRFEYVQWEEP